jgi:hypothetical protein
MRLRDYADQLATLGKHAAAEIWREMADRIDASQLPHADKPTRIWFDQHNGRTGL